eukprot:6429787-Prymnesium_polylepis.2
MEVNAAAIAHSVQEALDICAEPEVDSRDEEVGEIDVLDGLGGWLELESRGVRCHPLGHGLESFRVTLLSLDPKPIHQAVLVHQCERVGHKALHADILIDAHRIFVARERTKPKI